MGVKCQMIRCSSCDCLCDPGDIRGGKCDTCREAEQASEMRQEWNRKMLARSVAEQQDGQFKMILA